MSNSIRLLLPLLFACLITPQVRSQIVDDMPNVSYQTKRIKLGEKILTIEVADTPERRTKGLMFRKSLAPNSGMLFIFESEQPLNFWMKNTLIPLSIGYFDSRRRLVDIQEMVPAVIGQREPKTYPSAKPAMFALEMEKQWFTKNHIKVGATFDFVK